MSHFNSPYFFSFPPFLQPSHRLFTPFTHRHVFKVTTHQPQTRASPQVAAIQGHISIYWHTKGTDSTLNTLSYSGSSGSLKMIRWMVCIVCVDTAMTIKFWIYCAALFDIVHQ